MMEKDKIILFGHTDGKAYALNLEAVMDFVGNIDADEQYNNTTVTQSYGADADDNEVTLMAKEITESRLNGNDTISNFRYDLIKYVIERAFETVDTADFGRSLALNTLLTSGIINIYLKDEDEQ